MPDLKMKEAAPQLAFGFAKWGQHPVPLPVETLAETAARIRREHDEAKLAKGKND